MFVNVKSSISYIIKECIFDEKNTNHGCEQLHR